VFPKPRQLDSEEELYDVALRALMRRGHSVEEMKRKLSRHSRNELLVRVVLARLKENGQLDDERFAKQFARTRSEGRKQGKFRIARDLRARGVADRYIATALEESSGLEASLVRERIARKLRASAGKSLEKRLASIYRSLLAAGFPADVIRRELKALTREELPAADPDDTSLL
jgi:regulatory protein